MQIVQSTASETQAATDYETVCEGLAIGWDRYWLDGPNPGSRIEEVADIKWVVIDDAGEFLDAYGAEARAEFLADPIGWTSDRYGEWLVTQGAD